MTSATARVGSQQAGPIQGAFGPSAGARLAHFPVSFFAMVMGLTGLAIAWEKAAAMLEVELVMVPWLIGLSVLLFALLLSTYLAKLFIHPEAVLAEMRHPVRLNFMPTISISLLLLAIALLHGAPGISLWLWVLGALVQLLFTLYIVSVWMHHQHFQIHHMNPSWFIPAVGNALVPIAGVPLGFVETSWFFFSIGVLLWAVLMTIIFYRVLFHQSIDARLMPTLFILIAPPSVAFIAYLQLTDKLDVFAQALYFVGVFLTLLLFSQARRFFRLDFYLSWWAYSFPLAAVSIASMRMFDQTGTAFHAYLGFALLTLLTGIVMMLSVSTAMLVRERGICVQE
ncbi:Tellurite resistance protein TehA [Thiorhodovibrio winogradskyi]|uniref:Tellurite resistance protein TehA n=2 Tax=Thiorhodovibrio winogradskyi TaxID=77007 RepID=A0ABZ0SA17_9GAMM|nr:SLAC1 anion channel family protein [Thiorhodovibrio winogradskyi]